MSILPRVLSLGIFLGGLSGCDVSKPSAVITAPIARATTAEVQAETVRLFLAGEYAKIEELSLKYGEQRERLADGAWALEAQMDAFDVRFFVGQSDQMEGRFAKWEKQIAGSQVRATAAARHWRSARTRGGTAAERETMGRLRVQALASVEQPIEFAPLAVEQLMRLTSRDADREKAAAIYAAGIALLPGYEPLVEGYAGWLSGFAATEVGPWLGGEADKIGGEEGDEVYARVAISRPRSGVNWIALRKLDWPRMQRGFESMQRRWPGATGVLDKMAKAAFACGDRAAARKAFAAMTAPARQAWSDNIGFYFQVRRFAGVEKPSDIQAILEMKPERQQRLVAAAFSPDGEHLAIGGAKGELSVWKLPELTLVWTGANPHWISSLAYSADGRWLAVSGGHFHDNRKGGNVRVWEVATRTVAVSLDDLPEEMNAVAFSPKSDVLWAGGGKKKGRLVFWKPGDPQMTTLPEEFTPSAAIQDIAVGDQRVFVAAWREIWLLNTVDPEAMALDFFYAGTASYRDVALSPDGRRLAAGTWMKNNAWDTPACVQLHDATRFGGDAPIELQVRGTKVEGIRFTEDGRRLLVSSNASDVSLWNLADAETSQQFYGDGWTIDALAVSADSKRAATIDTSGTVRVWNIDDSGPVER